MPEPRPTPPSSSPKPEARSNLATIGPRHGALKIDLQRTQTNDFTLPAKQPLLLLDKPISKP
jgi:hypothetical protein